MRFVALMRSCPQLSSLCHSAARFPAIVRKSIGYRTGRAQQKQIEQLQNRKRSAAGDPRTEIAGRDSRAASAASVASEATPVAPDSPSTQASSYDAPKERGIALGDRSASAGTARWLMRPTT